MELEGSYLDQQQYNNQMNNHLKSGYVQFGFHQNYNNSEVLQPFHNNGEEDEMQMEQFDDNFLFVGDDKNHHYQNHYDEYAHNLNIQGQQSFQGSSPSLSSSEVYSSRQQGDPTSNSTYSYNLDMTNNQFSLNSQNESSSHTDSTSQCTREDCEELRQQDRQYNIATSTTNPQQQQLQQISKPAPSQNEQYVVKSIIAVDVLKQPNNFEFKYGERPYVIINPLQGFYFLSGDICVMNTMLSKEFTRFSELNSFKSPVKTYSNQQVGSLEVDLNNKRSGIKNFGFLIEKLRSYSSQRSYQFSVLLERYQKYVNDLQEKKELLKNEETMNHFHNYLDNSFNKFAQKCTKVLENIAQTHTFYSYTVNKLNLFNFEMEMRKYGYSEALLALLGLDVQQAQQYIWRKGLFDYMDKKNIEDMLYQYIAHQLGETNFQPCDVTLHTFDGLEVYAINNVRVFINMDANNPFLGYNEVLMVNLYDVSPNMIAQVMELRKLSKDKSRKYLRDLEEDLSYSMEATIFLEKYYKTATQNFLPSDKRAGYRVINQTQQQNEKKEEETSS